MTIEPNLHAVAKRCDDIATANGFDRPTWDNFPVKIMMTVTELDEAVDGVRGRGEDPFAEELADVAIRVLSVLVALGHSWSDRVTHRQNPHALNRFVLGHKRRESPNLFLGDVEVEVWPIMGHLCKAVERWRRSTKVNADVISHLELALLETWRLADQCEIDLFKEIDAKCAKNETRGHLHGKARSEA